jgi:ribosome-associated protein
MATDTDPSTVPERPSKSQRKRDMTELQDIGTRLVLLSADQLSEFNLPERLREAIEDAQRIRNFEGRRRQMQFIGKLMREVDAAPIRARLEQWDGAGQRETAQLRQIERWRDELLAGEDALTRFATTFPGCDLQNVRSLIASVQRDTALKKPPKHYRELFRAIGKVFVSRAQEHT